jgi:hypothetical protein
MSPIVNGGSPAGLPTPPGGLNVTQWILLLASQQLQDETGVKWKPDTMLPYVNLAIKEIIILKPEAYTQIYNTTLVSGAKQSVPSTTNNILDISFNMGLSGTVRGDAVISLPKEKLDYLLPNWPTFPAAIVVKYAVIDKNDNKSFYIIPPQPNPAPGQYLEILLSVFPADLEASDDTFPLDTMYQPACVDYIVGRALLEETSIPNAQAKGQSYMTRFMQDLGLMTNAERQIDSGGR